MNRSTPPSRPTSQPTNDALYQKSAHASRCSFASAIEGCARHGKDAGGGGEKSKMNEDERLLMFKIRQIKDGN